MTFRQFVEQFGVETSALGLGDWVLRECVLADETLKSEAFGQSAHIAAHSGAPVGASSARRSNASFQYPFFSQFVSSRLYCNPHKATWLAMNLSNPDTLLELLRRCYKRPHQAAEHGPHVVAPIEAELDLGELALALLGALNGVVCASQ